jgi:hypothetical protein
VESSIPVRRTTGETEYFQYDSAKLLKAGLLRLSGVWVASGKQQVMTVYHVNGAWEEVQHGDH